MSRYVEGENRNQISMEPLCLDDMIGEENPVRAIEMIVEKMEIGTLGFKYSETAETGRSRTRRKRCSNYMRTVTTTESGRQGR